MAVGLRGQLVVAVSAGCVHPQCATVTETESLGLNVVAVLTGIAFERVCEQAPRGPKPDYRSAPDGRRVAVEVKRLTSGAMQRHHAHSARYLSEDDPFHSVPSLHCTWLVFIDTTSARETFGNDASAPRLETLIDDLVVELRRLEADGQTEGGRDPAVRRLTHSWTCSAIRNSPRGPGIIISESHGGTRSTDIDIDVVEFIGKWLLSAYADNLRASLLEEAGQRIAVLVADTSGPGGGMIRTLWEDETCPKQPLPLPVEIDALVLIAGGHVLDFGFVDGWRRRTLESLDVV